MLKQEFKYRIASICFLFLLACGKAETSQTFTVTNNLDITREQEIISIAAENVSNLIQEYGIDNLLIREQDQEDYLVSQSIDTDLNGDIDEILFQATINAREKKTFIIEAIENGAGLKPKSDLTTFSRFVADRHDYAWENDRVAFRIYGSQNPDSTSAAPAGGAIDAFLKRVSYPVINKWYKNNAEKEGAYHIDTGEGHDPYQVGASRGIGGIGIWDKDSLYVSSNFISSKTITEGPLRTIFELTFAPWDANGRKVKETKRISLDLGNHLSRIEEILSSDKPLPNVVAGITLHDKSGEVKANTDEGWFRYWEPMDDSALGTAIVLDPSIVSEFKDHRTESRDQSHLFVFTKALENNMTFYAGFAWQKSGHFKSAEEWDNYLSEFSRKLRSPLKPEFIR